LLLLIITLVVSLSVFLTIFTVYESSKLTAVSQDRKRAEEMEFRKAGTGPIPKTYASDPTKTQKKRQSLSS